MSFFFSGFAFEKEEEDLQGRTSSSTTSLKAAVDVSRVKEILRLILLTPFVM